MLIHMRERIYPHVIPHMTRMYMGRNMPFHLLHLYMVVSKGVDLLQHLLQHLLQIFRESILKELVSNKRSKMAGKKEAKNEWLNQLGR